MSILIKILILDLYKKKICFNLERIKLFLFLTKIEIKLNKNNKYRN